MTKPDVALVVVLHDSAAEFAALLASLDAHGGGLDVQLVVVDCGRADGGADLARARRADVIALPENPGFGAANNAGLQAVRAEVTVLLNPDCELLDDAALPALLAAARARPHALHAPRLLNPDGSVQRSAHPAPGTLGTLLPALVHPALLPPALRVRSEPHRAARSRTVGWAIAACLAADTALLRRLGPFDPSIHLFAEDMELGLRARDQGISTVLHPSLRIQHVGGHATLRAGEPFDLLARQRRAVIARTRGTRALHVDDLAQALTFVTRGAARTLLGRPAARERAQLRALGEARRAAPEH